MAKNKCTITLTEDDNDSEKLEMTIDCDPGFKVGTPEEDLPYVFRVARSFFAELVGAYQVGGEITSIKHGKNKEATIC